MPFIKINANKKVVRDFDCLSMVGFQRYSLLLKNQCMSICGYTKYSVPYLGIMYLKWRREEQWPKGGL